jgi:serine/threonine protein kinase
MTSSLGLKTRHAWHPSFATHTQQGAYQSSYSDSCYNNVTTRILIQHLPEELLTDIMSQGCRTRKAQFEWDDYTGVRLSPSPTKHSRVTAATKKGARTWIQRRTSNKRPRVYVCKTVGIDGDSLKDRDIPREYKTWSSLGSHPHILACDDFQYQEKSHHYNLDEATFWSEYCENGDLAQFIISGGSGRTILSLSQVEQVAYQISSALAFIHYGLLVTLDTRGSVQELESCDHKELIHRDIKPHNSISYLSCTANKL